MMGAFSWVDSLGAFSWLDSLIDELLGVRQEVVWLFIYTRRESVAAEHR